MDKLQKALKKLSKEHSETFKFLVLRLYSRDFLGLDIARVRGAKDVYRLKHGRLRLIFTMTNGEIRLIDLSLRNEKTYKNY